MNNKIYDKFKGNNLPTPFYDDDRNTIEYVSFNDGELNVDYNLLDALGNLSYTNLYYSFSIMNRHSHGHSFEDVLMNLYNYPETFNISSEEEIYYSKQELEYIRRVQKFLLFIKLKDRTEIEVNRFNNKVYDKYAYASIHSYKDKTIESFINKTRNFVVIIPYDISVYENYNIEGRKELVVDNNDNFIMYIEY